MTRCPFDGTELTDDDGDSWPYCPVCGYEPDGDAEPVDLGPWWFGRAGDG
jgi:hypothetical protein